MSGRNFSSLVCTHVGYWHQRADERYDNPPPKQPGAICGQRQSWKTPRWASLRNDIFPSVLWHCWLGNRKGIRPVKSWALVVTIWLKCPACLTAPVVTTTSIIISSDKPAKVHLEKWPSKWKESMHTQCSHWQILMQSCQAWHEKPIERCTAFYVG